MMTGMQPAETASKRRRELGVSPLGTRQKTLFRIETYVIFVANLSL